MYRAVLLGYLLFETFIELLGYLDVSANVSELSANMEL